MNGELAPRQQPAAPLMRSPTPGDLLQVALSSGADLDRLERLMDLQQKWEANEARKAYTAAMAEFKLNPPEILKKKRVEFGNTKYNHAELGDVAEAIVAGLAEVGVSHRWIPTQDGQKITVTCELMHLRGHSESISLTGAPDASGQKNGVQQIASTVTYFCRYTLLLACGLATKAIVDDDGRGASGRPGKQAVARTAPDDSPERDALVEQGYAAADAGTEEFRRFYAALTRDERALIGDHRESFRLRCAEADKAEPVDA